MEDMGMPAHPVGECGGLVAVEADDVSMGLHAEPERRLCDGMEAWCEVRSLTETGPRGEAGPEEADEDRGGLGGRVEAAAGI